MSRLIRLKTSIAILMLSVALTTPTQACLNTFSEEIQLSQVYERAAELKSVTAEAEAKYASEATLENSNDLAVLRIFQGRYAEAIAMLRQVEAKYPGQAIVAANLGTALELGGKDSEALRWIRTGVQRDPLEHYGTEWLHVMILEAKISIAKDPAWLKHHGVLGLDFGTGSQPRSPELPVEIQGDLRDETEIGTALSFQLGERVKFVKPPDPIVSDLLMTLASLTHAHNLRIPPGKAEYGTGELRFIDRLYEQAQQYGFTNTGLIDARRKQLLKDFPAAFAESAKPAKVKKP